MDKTGADFEYSVKTIRDRLGVKATPIQLPIGAEQDFVGIIDLIEMHAIYYDGEHNEDFEIKPIPADMLEKAKE
jgi:elongation factor G